MKRWQISRRHFLRGAGAALALPMLDAMGPRSAWGETAATEAAAGATTLPSATAAVSAGGAPLRTAFLYFPNGAWMQDWRPKLSGENYELPFSLKPLEPFKSEMSVLSGLDKAASHGGDGHYAKTANFLTGEHVNKTTGKDISAGGISIDQVIAQRWGDVTPIPSLELSIDPIVSGIDSLVGYTRLYASYISWRGPNVPVAREMQPRAVYDRLFGAKDKAGKPSVASRDREDDQSLLDLALDDANSLRRRVGRDDQSKIDEYLESVRSVEKRIGFTLRPDARRFKGSATPAEIAAATPHQPKDYLDHVRLMLELQVLAFWTDSTRVSSFMFANDVSGRNFSGLIDGVNGAHHEMSHHQNIPDKIEQYRKINRWHVEQFAWMLGKMRAIKDGDGTLLDHSQILFGSSFSDGNRHDPENLPIVLAGGGCGTLRQGRHIASPRRTPLCNLYLSMLDRAGAAGTHFGDSTEKLDGLES